MAGLPNESLDLSGVPLFPLPNVVLVPQAVLPLHIFEERYKAMTADALRGDRLIAMALLKPGWEKCYYSRPAIEPVVCAGIILSHEKLADGTYNFLLQGLVRATVAREHGQEPYRLAELHPLKEVLAPELELMDERSCALSSFLSRRRWRRAASADSSVACWMGITRRRRSLTWWRSTSWKIFLCARPFSPRPTSAIALL